MAKGQGKGASAGKGRPANEAESDADELGLGEDAGHGGGLDDGRGAEGDVPDPGAGGADPWKRPFHLRFRLYAIAGLIISAAWVWGVWSYVEQVLGWSNVAQLLPHEVGGLAAGAMTPLALLWMVIAFGERGQSLRRDTEVLRWHMRRLIYPSDK